MGQVRSEPDGSAPGQGLPLPDPEILAVLAASGDLVLVLDRQGQIAWASPPAPALQDTIAAQGTHRKLADCVAPDSRAKVTALLAEPEMGRAREINLLTASDAAPGGLPVRAIVRPLAGWLVLTARDLSDSAISQARLAEAALAGARELEAARQGAARARRTVQAAPVALMTVDLSTRRVVEANPAAAHLLGQEPAGLALSRLVDGPDLLPALIEGTESGGLMQTQSGRPVWIEMGRVRDGRRLLGVAALLPQDGTVSVMGEAPGTAWQEAPVALMLLDGGLRVSGANAAAQELFQVSGSQALAGRPLSDLIGRSPADAQVFGANLREHGQITGFTTVLRTAHGALEPIELTALSRQGRPGHTLMLRPPPGRAPAEPGPDRSDKVRAPDAMLGLIGQLPLKDIVRESADMIEQMCIEAALDLTGGNRANAAEMLGLSRQSLYTKLHKLGLFDPASSADGETGA